MPGEGLDAVERRVLAQREGRALLLPDGPQHAAPRAADEALEPAYKAQLLMLPGESDIAREIRRDVDPAAIHEARTTLANERVAMAQGTALGNPMEALLRVVAEGDADAALQERLGRLILAAQIGALLDQRIAQLAVGGRDTGAEASVRKLLGVRYRQALSEIRMELSPTGGAVVDALVHDFLNTRCLTIAGGTEQILLTLAGERLLGLPR